MVNGHAQTVKKKKKSKLLWKVGSSGEERLKNHHQLPIFNILSIITLCVEVSSPIFLLF